MNEKFQNEMQLKIKMDLIFSEYIVNIIDHNKSIQIESEP